MDSLWIAAGVVLILAGIYDLFMTVLYYDSAGPLSLRLYRLVWGVIRRVAGRLPERHEAFTLSLGMPLMILASLVLWISLQVVGFAAIYYVGLHQGAFRFAEGLEASPVEALYVSGISISGLGYGDIAPITAPYQLATVMQALTGYGFLTLAIAYVVNVYKVAEDMSTLASDIYHESQRTYDARYILEVHFHEGQPRDLSGRLNNFYWSLVAHHEGMRHYPVVYYFYSRRGYAALPYRFGLVGKVIAALRWGLPSGNPVTEEPWLHALVSAYVSISDEMLERFLEIESWGAADQPVDRESFAQALSTGRSLDSMVARFLELLDFLEELTEQTQPRDPEEVYRRYCEWLPFMSRVEGFLDVMVTHLTARQRLLTSSN